MEGWFKHILKSLGWALASMPLAVLGITVFLVIAQAASEAFFKAWDSKLGWIVAIGMYAALVVYFYYSPELKMRRERRSTVDVLVQYLKQERARSGKPQPNARDIESVRAYLLERVKFWAWNDAVLWNMRFRNEEYPESLFAIVDAYLLKIAELERANNHASSSR